MRERGLDNIKYRYNSIVIVLDTLYARVYLFIWSVRAVWECY